MSAVRANPSRLPVPHSNACVDGTRGHPDAGLFAGRSSVQVRCGSCEHRLFDIAVTTSIHPDRRMPPETLLILERVCPTCKRKVRGGVTGDPGEPCPGGLDGPWRCGCGGSLGYVEPVRGRVRTTCRCGTEVRVTAGEAIAVGCGAAPTTIRSTEEGVGDTPL